MEHLKHNNVKNNTGDDMSLRYICMQIKHYQELLSHLNKDDSNILKKREQNHDKRAIYYENKILNLYIQLEKEMDCVYK